MSRQWCVVRVISRIPGNGFKVVETWLRDEKVAERFAKRTAKRLRRTVQVRFTDSSPPWSRAS